MATWLENLKVGDVVSLHDSLQKVGRLTATQVILESGRKFRRKTGRIIGHGGGWSISHLQEADQVEVDRIRQMRLAARLEGLNWKGFPLDVLREVGDLVSAYNAAETP